MSKIVIINADDFGISHGVNRAVAEAHLNGVLNSASLMVNTPYTQEAVQIVKKLPNLKIGLHICLVGGKPVSAREEVPYLLDNYGQFPKRGINLIGNLCCFNRKMLLRDIYKEIKAQVELMLSLGLKISHIDSHDHVHTFPPIFDIVIKLAKEYKIPRIRYTNPKFTKPGNVTNLIKGCVLSILASSSKNKLIKNGISFAEHLWGVVESGSLNEEKLTSILRSLPDGLNEIMCHPGYVDKELLEIFPVVYNWEEELKALTSPKARDLISDYGAKFI